MRQYGVWTALAAGAMAVAVSGCSKSGGSGDGSTAAGSAAPSGPVTLSTIPHRKSGLWKMTFTTDRSGAAMPATEMCVDETSEAKMSAVSVGARRQDCAAHTFTRNLDGSISFSSTCAISAVQGAQSTVHGAISGSFDSAYKMEMEATTTGMPSPAQNGTHTMSMSGVYEGPCPAGQHGGDMTMTMPNGQKMTMPGGMAAGQ